MKVEQWLYHWMAGLGLACAGFAAGATAAHIWPGQTSALMQWAHAAAVGFTFACATAVWLLQQRAAHLLHIVLRLDEVVAKPKPPEATP